MFRDLLDRDAAPQRGRHDAAGAGTHNQLHLADRHGQPLLQRDESSGHPGGAEHAARAEHQTDSRMPVRHRRLSESTSHRRPPMVEAPGPGYR